MKIAEILSGLLILTSLSGCDFIASFFDSELVKACESAVKFRLRSPSGYERVEISRSEDAPMDRAAYAQYLSSFSSDYRTERLQDFDLGKDKPVLFSLLISYDAPNAYGTPERAHARCEYVNRSGDETWANELVVMVDGQTNAAWLQN